MYAIGYVTPAARELRLLTQGNAKLGRRVWTFSLPAGDSCPGATAFCARVCYAKRGRVALQRSRYLQTFDLAIPVLEPRLRSELGALPPRAAVRIHASGDFHSAAYIDMWARLASEHPGRAFWAYTRSWAVAELLPALAELGALPNVALWASVDPTTETAPPAGWRVAGIVADWADAPGIAHCPEQTGRRTSCSDCGLCWRAKPGARLAFHLH